MSKLRPDRMTDLRQIRDPYLCIQQRVPARYGRARNRACVDGQPAYHLSLKRETDRFGHSSFACHGGTPWETSVLEDYGPRCHKCHLTEGRARHHKLHQAWELS
jgi:hypothetical protein